MRSAGEKSELFIRKFAELVGLKAELAAMAMANGDEEVRKWRATFWTNSRFQTRCKEYSWQTATS